MKSELGKLAKGVSSEETDTKNPGFIDKIVNSLNKIQRESFIIKGNGCHSVTRHLQMTMGRMIWVIWLKADLHSTKSFRLKFSRKGIFALFLRYCLRRLIFE